MRTANAASGMKSILQPLGNDRVRRWAQRLNATRYFSSGDGAWLMKRRRRIYYSTAQRAEIWDRWQAGESMSSIRRRFDRESSSVFSVLSPTGGIRPPDRRRSPRVLSLSEREEI